MRYTLDFREDDTLTCWYCGEAVEKATIIEWQKGHQKEILCDTCLGQLYRNEKKVKILAEVYK